MSFRRHSRAQPSDPAFGRPKDKLRADPRIAGGAKLVSEVLGSGPSMTRYDGSKR